MRLALLLLALCALPCLGAAQLRWGAVGHFLTGAVAMPFVNANATRALRNLLPEFDGNMGHVASWADSVGRDKYPWSPSLHFINTPDWVCNYDRARDCQYKGEAGVCVDNAIQNFTSQLYKNDAPLGLGIALRFLVHFIGDIHQPLHVGFSGDLGGNTIIGTFMDSHNRKLHQIWDSDIINKRMRDDFGNSNATYTDYFVKRMQTGDWSSKLAEWVRCPPSDPSRLNACSQHWATEGIELACSAAYLDHKGEIVRSGFSLGDDYHRYAVPIIEQQVAKAAARMAATVNAVFELPSMQRFVEGEKLIDEQ